MSCNCKNKLKTMEGYSDNISEDENLNIVEKILQNIMQIGFGIIIGAILIVIMVPFLLYLIICIMFKKEPSFRIINFNKNKIL